MWLGLGVGILKSTGRRQQQQFSEKLIAVLPYIMVEAAEAENLDRVCALGPDCVDSDRLRCELGHVHTTCVVIFRGRVQGNAELRFNMHFKSRAQ